MFKEIIEEFIKIITEKIQIEITDGFPKKQQKGHFILNNIKEVSTAMTEGIP